MTFLRKNGFFRTKSTMPKQKLNTRLASDWGEPIKHTWASRAKLAFRLILNFRIEFRSTTCTWCA